MYFAIIIKIQISINTFPTNLFSDINVLNLRLLLIILWPFIGVSFYVRLSINKSYTCYEVCHYIVFFFHSISNLFKREDC